MEIDRSILSRYFQGEATEDEKEAIHHWLESNADNKKQFIHERIRFDASLIIADDILRPDERVGKIRRMALTMLKIASAILLFVGSSYVINHYFVGQQQVVMQSIHVPAGNRTSLTLPDGTLVWLNSNTTLTYPNIFKGERKVVLNGEAYFEVRPDKDKTFIVKTGKRNIQVLGTIFNVDAYEGKPGFETALFTGKVKLYKEAGEDDVTYLEAGQLAQLVGDSLHIASVDYNNYRWRDGLIIFEDKSFEEIMHVFEKYYGQQIIIENKKVIGRRYRGKLRIADGLDHALRVLQNDVRFTYKQDEDANKIYIY